MVRKITASLVFAALTAGAIPAAGSVDVAQEVKAGDITISAQELGPISVKGCSNCAAYEFETTPATTYEIGDLLVRRDEMRRELLRRPRQVMLVQLTPDRKHVARLRITPAAQ